MKKESIVVKRTFAELAIGQSAKAERVVTLKDVQTFAKVSGDYNPIHLNAEYASKTPFRSRIAHGALITSFVSGLIGMKLPGPGTVAVSLDLKFRQPVYLWSKVFTIVEIVDIDDRRGFIKLSCICSVEGKVVIKGEALVSFPLDKKE